MNVADYQYNIFYFRTTGTKDHLCVILVLKYRV